MSLTLLLVSSQMEGRSAKIAFPWQDPLHSYSRHCDVPPMYPSGTKALMAQLPLGVWAAGGSQSILLQELPLAKANCLTQGDMPSPGAAHFHEGPQRSGPLTLIKNNCGDFPGGTVVKNPPANAGDMGSSPGPGRSHMPRNN